MEKISVKQNYRRSYGLIKHLSTPSKFLYWGDLLGTALCAYTLMYICMSSPIDDPIRWVSFIASVFFVNRGIYLMHEVVHQGKHLKGYGFAQNLLFGCVFKYPSYIHEPHNFHHSTSTYGSSKDPEYDDAWIGQSRGRYFSVIPVSLILPYLQTIRFGVMPLGYIFFPKSFMNKIYQRASTFALNESYVRPLPDKFEYRRWMFQDALCAFINTLMLIGIVAGSFSIENFLTFQLYSSAFFFLNFFRALVAHKYARKGEAMEQDEQVRDSISIPSSFTDFFWAPVGLKYHSLHHYFPTIPYHNLAKAHKLLVQAQEPTYLASIEESFPKAISKALKGDSMSLEQDEFSEEKIKKAA